MWPAEAGVARRPSWRPPAGSWRWPSAAGSPPDKLGILVDRLAELVARGPVLFDGAMGTELFARDVGADTCLEELNLTDPTRVSGIYRDYIAAGADAIETNTFGANRSRLVERVQETLDVLA